MKIKLLDIMVCPKCGGALRIGTENVVEIAEGELICSECSALYPVINGIPRFIESDNYASSFGYQWNIFRREQIDSHNGTTLSADRFWSETLWEPEELSGKWILDAGCGAGRFLDAGSKAGGEFVGIDISNAIDAAKANLEGRENVHFVQASIYEMPFRKGAFDFCYCIGVIQHTPDREGSLRAICDMVKSGGEVAATIYPRKFYTRLFSKYWVRPITKRLPKQMLLNLIRGIMPIAFPITDVLFRLPLVGKFFMFAVPIANYVNEKQLNRKQRRAWAILDTFDMLSPQYDRPMTEQEASGALSSAGCEVRRTANPGLNLIGKKLFTSAEGGVSAR